MDVSVRDLKNRTSECLRRVQAGARLIVTDRGRPIAEISRIDPERLTTEQRLARLAERGVLTLPRGRGLADVTPMKRRGRSVAETLLEDRD